MKLPVRASLASHGVDMQSEVGWPLSLVGAFEEGIVGIGIGRRRWFRIEGLDDGHGASSLQKKDKVEGGTKSGGKVAVKRTEDLSASKLPVPVLL